MEEVDEAPIIASPTPAVSAPETSSIVAPPAVVPVDDTEAAEESTLFQKGAFFVVIVGCVVVYMRISSRKTTRYQEKSLA